MGGVICSRLPGSNQNSWVPGQGFLLRFLFSFAFVSPCLCFLFLGREPGACTCHWPHEVACPWGRPYRLLPVNSLSGSVWAS